MNRDELIANVETIVVVMMENRSFDHVLGYLRHPQFGNRSEIEGIADLANIDFINPNDEGVGQSPFFMADGPLPSDLPHDPAAVAKQLAFSTIKNTFTMTGFVRAFEDEFQSSGAEPPVLGLLQPADLPTTSALAARYTVCDHWFACVPTSTAPNRLMSMCGTTDHEDTQILLPNQQTVYDWLEAHRVSWRVYSAGLPFFALMPRMAPVVLSSQFRFVSELAGDIGPHALDAWPQVVFIEPDYYDCPVHFRSPCDNHAPLGMAPGEAFVAEVLRTLSTSSRWEKMVVILTYDEHGGFFDHVPPLDVKYQNPNGVNFASTGPRVPAIVCGPFAPKGVSKATLDNTSILQLLAERFGAKGESFSTEVAHRAAQGIASASTVLSAAAANDAPLPAFGQAATQAVPPLPAAQNMTTQSFTAAGKALVTAHRTDALTKFPGLAALGD